MIRIRHYGKSDFAQVTDLHAKLGLAFQLPDPEDKTMLVRTVVEQDSKITQAAFLRKTSELYWVFDPSVDRRRERIQCFTLLHKEMTTEAMRAGFRDVHFWTPPEIAQDTKYDRTMLRMGWERSLWTCYKKELR